MGDFLLIKELKEDEENVAWRKVYIMYKSIIKDYINIYIPNFMLLDDMVHDVFLKNMGMCEKVATMGQLKGRLLKTAENLVKDYYRGQQREKKITEAELVYYESMLDDEEIQSFIERDAEKINQIVMAINEEPDKRKEVGLYLINGLSVNQISEKMGISIQTVHRHKYDLIVSLQKKLGSDLSKYNLLGIIAMLLIPMLYLI